MKISGIQIKDFQQFKEFTLDLTYPKGHEKEGLPLDKVCFIGQSGTGKTTLLNFILECSRKITSVSYQLVPVNYASSNKKNDYSLNSKEKIKLKTEIYFSFENFSFCLSNGKFADNKNWDLSIFNPESVENDEEKLRSIFRRLHSSTDHFVINYPADINMKHKFVTRKTPQKKFDDKKIIDFKDQKLTPIWSKVYSEVVDFRQKETNFRVGLTKRAEVETINIKEEIEKWKKGSENPLINLAGICLNPIISKFGLEIETDLPNIQNIDVIRAKSVLNNKIVPFESLSTGTKQIILTALPLYELKTENSIILVDEPENSLYPDIQQIIIDYYQSLAPSAQFFYATHSPVIASSFEPWEIVELKFDYDKKQVIQELYFKEERHVANYFINPQFLRWDSILTKVFDLAIRGNEKRTEKLMELTMLGKKIEKEENNNKKVEFYQEYRKLACLLDWETK